jgi:hypothetical protein
MSLFRTTPDPGVGPDQAAFAHRVHPLAAAGQRAHDACRVNPAARRALYPSTPDAACSQAEEILMLKKFVIAGALLAAGGVAQAQGAPDSAAWLGQADANQDGLVVREEFLAARSEQFARMDRNSDGYVDEAERQALRAERSSEHKAARDGRHAGRMHRMHARMDADGDGKVSKEEFLNAGGRMFDRLDADDNSVLDAQEIAAARERGKRQRRRPASTAESL